MKKILPFVCTAILLATVASPLAAQVRFGLKAGLNLANISSSSDYADAFELAIGDEYNPSMLLSYHIGGMAEFGLSGPLGLSIGLQLSGKGTRYEFESVILNTPYEAVAKEKPLYLQVPLALTFRKNGFYAGIGPYAGFGISGSLKVKVKAQGETGSDSQDIKFGNGAEDSYAPLDFGAGIELGYEFLSFRVSGSFNMGLNNALPKDQVDAVEEGLDYSRKHRVFGLSFAYLFGKQ